MARKPDLPGAADFFQTGSSSTKSTTADETNTRENTPQADAPETPSPEAGESGSGRNTRSSKKSRPEQPTPTAELDSLSMEPPQTIEQPPTEKVTFYLPARMLQELEVCRVRLLTEYNIKVNRSQITQAALALTLKKPELLQDALLQLDELARELQEASG